MADWPSLIPFILTPGGLWGRSGHQRFLLDFRNFNYHWEPRDRKNENLASRSSSANELCDFTDRGHCRARWQCWHLVVATNKAWALGLGQAPCEDFTVPSSVIPRNALVNTSLESQVQLSPVFQVRKSKLVRLGNLLRSYSLYGNRAGV